MRHDPISHPIGQDDCSPDPNTNELKERISLLESALYYKPLTEFFGTVPFNPRPLFVAPTKRASNSSASRTTGSDKRPSMVSGLSSTSRGEIINKLRPEEKEAIDFIPSLRVSQVSLLVKRFIHYAHPKCVIINADSLRDDYWHHSPILLAAISSVASTYPPGLGQTSYHRGSQFHRIAKNLLKVSIQKFKAPTSSEAMRLEVIMAVLIMLQYTTASGSSDTGFLIETAKDLATFMRLDYESEEMASKQHIEIKTELRRRVWWALVETERFECAANYRMTSLPFHDFFIGFPQLEYYRKGAMPTNTATDSNRQMESGGKDIDAIMNEFVSFDEPDALAIFESLVSDNPIQPADLTEENGHQYDGLPEFVNPEECLSQLAFSLWEVYDQSFAYWSKVMKDGNITAENDETFNLIESRLIQWINNAPKLFLTVSDTYQGYDAFVADPPYWKVAFYQAFFNFVRLQHNKPKMMLQINTDPEGCFESTSFHVALNAAFLISEITRRFLDQNPCFDNVRPEFGLFIFHSFEVILICLNCPRVVKRNHFYAFNVLRQGMNRLSQFWFPASIYLSKMSEMAKLEHLLFKKNA